VARWPWPQYVCTAKAEGTGPGKPEGGGEGEDRAGMVEKEKSPNWGDAGVSPLFHEPRTAPEQGQRKDAEGLGPSQRGAQPPRTLRTVRRAGCTWERKGGERFAYLSF
jgi:hypothetical protein